MQYNEMILLHVNVNNKLINEELFQPSYDGNQNFKAEIMAAPFCHILYNLFFWELGSQL